MYTIVSGIAALLFALVWGGEKACGAVLFAILGLYIYGKIAGVRLVLGAFPMFVLRIALGALGEVMASLSAESGGLVAAWLLFPAVIGLTFFSGGIRGAARKAVLLLYLCLVMMLQIHAAGEAQAPHHFLAMQTAHLFSAAYSILALPKRKNDA